MLPASVGAKYLRGGPSVEGTTRVLTGPSRSSRLGSGSIGPVVTSEVRWLFDQLMAVGRLLVGDQRERQQG